MQESVFTGDPLDAPPLQETHIYPNVTCVRYIDRTFFDCVKVYESSGTTIARLRGTTITLLARP